MPKKPDEAARAHRGGTEDARLLDTTGVAKLLDVHPKHVFRLLHRGLPGHRLGGGPWRFDEREVLRWWRKQSAAERRAPNAQPAPRLLAANGDVCVELLLGALQASTPLPFGFVQADATSGQAYLARREVVAAGAHGARLQPPEAQRVRVHVARRSVGLAHARGKPPPRLTDLAGLKLASRAATAGVRAHLDAALVAERLKPSEVHRRALICGSHRDVALALLSGKADVGLISVAWAARVGLACLPLADEDYVIELLESEQSEPAGAALLTALRSRELRRALSGAGGYVVSGLGELQR
jgi:excisionase family DNA binding protein